MIGLILTGHGVFSTGMHQSVSMIAGEQANVQAVPFFNDTGLDVLESNIRKAVDSMLETCPAVVILTDLLGGTPFRFSMTVASNYQNVEVLAGTNLPMVLEGLALRTISTNVEDFVSMVTDSARDGIVHKKLEQPQANTQEEADGI